MSWRGLGVPLTRFHQGSRFFPSLVSAGKRSNTLLSPWVQVCRLNSDLVTQNESHLTRHNDPPRSQAPSVIDQTQELDDKMIDKFKFKSFPKERLKDHPPPRIRVLEMDYDEPSLVLRSVDRVRIWGLGTYHLFANLGVAYDIVQAGQGGNRTRHGAKVINVIRTDFWKLSNFLFALLLFPPYAIVLFIFSLYNPFAKPSSFQHPRDVRKFLVRVCPEIGSWSDMMDEFVGIHPDLLSLYGKEFKVDMDTHCLSADDALRLFPHSKLAVCSITDMKHSHLVRISHAFPVYYWKSWYRGENFFNDVTRQVSKMLLDDQIRARTPGTDEQTPQQLWQLCHERGLFWTLNGKELSNGQYLYLYSQWMQLALVKQTNRKTLELLFFFIIFNVGRDVEVPDAKPSDWKFVQDYFYDFSLSAQMGKTGSL